MAVITIDGTHLEVPENKNVLECALEAGIYIPHLCNPAGGYIRWGIDSHH